MPDLVLRTFQSQEQVAHLHAAGVLVGDWEHVLPGTERAYRRMVEVMAGHGIDTGGRPPVWAWRGPLRLVDADSLLSGAHELRLGIATVTFRAPDRLVLLMDYGHWCDALMADTSETVDSWQPRRRNPRSHHPEQACLPYLRLEWVTDVTPLPTQGWETLDLEQPV